MVLCPPDGCNPSYAVAADRRQQRRAATAAVLSGSGGGTPQEFARARLAMAEPQTGAATALPSAMRVRGAQRSIRPSARRSVHEVACWKEPTHRPPA